MTNNGRATSGPLDGLHVLELGSFIAGPFAGQILGDCGATVIKIEPPDGDPMRTWGVRRDGMSLWWPAIARNKKSVCLNLRLPESREAICKIASRCDVVIENFRTGRLEEWGLGYQQLSKSNPALVMVHVSGFGQSGPRAGAAGFGSIGEAMGGIRFTTGSPDRPPSRSGISLGDELAGLFAVIGALGAVHRARETGTGQEVDVAIYEAVAALMESSMVDFELGGVLRTRTGSSLPGVAPSNAYPTKDESEIVIAANANSVFARLCEAMGRPSLATDQRFADHSSRGKNMEELDQIITEWSMALTSQEILATLDKHGVPAGMIFTAADMLKDEHYQAREMVLRAVSSQGWEIPMAGIVPKFSDTPGSVRTTGPALGAHTRQVLMELAGMNDEDYARLVEVGAAYDQAGQ